MGPDQDNRAPIPGLQTRWAALDVGWKYVFAGAGQAHIEQRLIQNCVRRGTARPVYCANGHAEIIDL